MQGRNTTLRRWKSRPSGLNGRPKKPKYSHVFGAIGYSDRTLFARFIMADDAARPLPHAGAHLKEPGFLEAGPKQKQWIPLPC